MATATGRFVSFSVVHIDLTDGPPVPLALTPARLPPASLPPALAVSRPSRIDPPPARSPAPARPHQSEDWSDIEALLTARIAVPETAAGRSRRRTLPLLVSSALGTAAFAGLVAVAYLTAGCGTTTAGCAARTAAKAPVAPERQAASSAAPPVRVAAQPETDVSQPVVQGRSVDEDDSPKAEMPAVDAGPAASEPRRHRKHHHHRWWW